MVYKFQINKKINHIVDYDYELENNLYDCIFSKLPWPQKNMQFSGLLNPNTGKFYFSDPAPCTAEGLSANPLKPKLQQENGKSTFHWVQFKIYKTEQDKFWVYQRNSASSDILLAALCTILDRIEERCLSHSMTLSLGTTSKDSYNTMIEGLNVRLDRLEKELDRIAQAEKQNMQLVQEVLRPKLPLGGKSAPCPSYDTPAP